MLSYLPSLITTSLLTISLVLAGEAENVINDGLDPKCAPGFHPGFQTNTFQFDIPAEIFFNQTGSFFHSDWYVGPLNSTQGEDNVVGCTRTGSVAGTLFRERLIEYSRSSSKLVQRFVLDDGPLVFPNVPTVQGNWTLGSFTKQMTVLSICGGRATYISFTSIYCTGEVATTYDLYDRLRRRAVDTLAEKLGARGFSGTCPIGDGM